MSPEQMPPHLRTAIQHYQNGRTNLNQALEQSLGGNADAGQVFATMAVAEMLAAQLCGMGLPVPQQENGS